MSEEIEQSVEVTETPAEETPATPPAKTSEELLAEKLSSVTQQAAEGALMAKLLVDPEIRSIVEARQRGEKVQVVRGETQPELKTLTVEQLNAMTPAELLGVISEQITAKLGGVVEEKVKSLQDKVSGLESYVKNSQRTSLQAQVEQAQKKYKDFDALRPDMINISQGNPGLTPEELYQIARIRRGAGPAQAPVAVNAATERPTQSAPRGGTLPKKIAPGRGGFESALEAAFEKVREKTQYQGSESGF